MDKTWALVEIYDAMSLGDGSTGEKLFERAKSNQECTCGVYWAATEPEMPFEKRL